jgi:peptidoglycan/xylan/chitin deacetylase (PgdA/CDA1 family)
MCFRCSPPILSRRRLGAVALAALAAGPAAASANALVEPALHLTRMDSEPPAVALTFDACPGAFDERIAHALIEHGIPATIFVTALWLARNRTGLALLLSHQDLFTLENHGARHIPAVLGDRTIYGLRSAGTLDAIRREVEEGAAAVTAASGVAPRWYRDATGLYSPDAITAIEHMGFAIAGYAVNSDAGASLPARTVAARIAAAPSGSVIIGHINQPTRPSGAGIVEGVLALKRQGMAFVRLEEAATWPVA